MKLLFINAATDGGMTARARRLLWCVAWAALVVQPVRATDYYLGSSATNQSGVALASIAALNAVQLRPGDRVFFQGGETFDGTVMVTAQDAGTREQPVVLTSFGSGRATLASGNASAIRIRNAAGIVIRGLDLRGADAATNLGSGVDAEVSLPSSTQLEYLRLEDLSIQGFNYGVWIGGWYSGAAPAWAGFRDVALTDLRISDVRSEGITVWGTWIAGGNGLDYSHRDVSIRRCWVSGVRGDPAATKHTGSGIVMGGVDGGLIEHCVAADNGGRGPTTGGGPFGIWAWESNRVTIQHNLVYGQRSSSDVDGGAYDLDGGTSNSVVQYNYSYGNDGPAIGLIQFEGSSPLTNNVVRYNISENDARKATRLGVLYVGNWDGAGPIDGVDVYHNTFYVSAAGSARPPLVMVESGGQVANVRVRNNLFVATHSGALLAGPLNRPERVLYQGNNYWGGSVDLTALRAQGQEVLAGQPLGLRVDPQLRAPGQGGAVTSTDALRQIDAYRLRAGSPLEAAGVDLRVRFGIDPGERDFFGERVPAGLATIGAALVSASPPPSNVSVGGGTLLNLSARARSGTGDDVLIVGWATEGDPALLLRGVGPGLQPYGVTGFLANPRLAVYDETSSEIASNDDWGTLRSAIESANAAVSAFALATRDAAVTRRFSAGRWSAMVRDDTRGVALAEIYRLPSGGSGRLVNLSARAYAGTGAETLIAGFVVGGGGAKVLLRALGPTLAQYGVSGYMEDPVLRLISGPTTLATNDNWGDGARADVRATGLAPPEGSRDAAILTTVAPGQYSVHVETANGRPGVALVEVYLLP